MIELEVDGKKVAVPEGSMVMHAANKLGIYVPHFCYHKKLSIAANCRMCLVQVEKAPKPMPACATPVTAGMKVFTHSDLAIDAQKAVMEFLLINHPLDCPICDQGGECQLQDLAVGYGASSSRYEEEKRVVSNKDLGPLIATDMTRCIYCTRCVRFGQEVAGIMELGMVGRGEHAEIMPFIEQTVNSELSGNMIDICPVGALTSKPFRYTARTWELSRRKSISPHCGLGANLIVQTKNNRVMRVLPFENEELNECWISDKDRFSYEGLNSDQRLTKPMLKKNGHWHEVEWQVALDHVAENLKRISKEQGAESVGALITPHSTLEEFYLLAKLLRNFGSNNIDFRLRQSDFSLDSKLQGALWLGMPINEFNKLDCVLIVGSFLAKDHPLIAQRLRRAAKKNLNINVIHAVDGIEEDWHMAITNKAIVSPLKMGEMLGEVVKSVAQTKGVAIPASVSALTVSPVAQAIATNLLSGKNSAIFLGNMAQHHPASGQLHLLAQELAKFLGAKFGFLTEAANSVGGYIADAFPTSTVSTLSKAQGKNTAQMLEKSLKAYLLFNVEPELDCYNPHQAIAAMRSASFVVALSAYKHQALDYAQVMLPIAPFSETSGTFINCEGRAQSFNGVVRPSGDTRPGWKVLRVLGNLLGLVGFDYDTSEEVRDELLGGKNVSAKLNNQVNISTIPAISSLKPRVANTIQRVADVPIYFADAIVRRAESLQNTQDAACPQARMNTNLMKKLNLKTGDSIRVTQDEGTATMTCLVDNTLPDECVRIATAHKTTADLGAMLGQVLIEKI